ncbi:DnaJ domain-containing protein [Trametes polyzona]|nr:DnaJ domain-containing protein [Trametes polyzona]
MQTFRILSLHPPAHRLRHPQAARVFERTRHFTTSRPRCEHYQTLDIPKDASKNQIKASFYKLSKKYHPDVNSDPGAKEKFQAVSEAYAILGDERKRRAYDRTLTPTSGQGHPGYTNAPHAHESHHPHWSYDGRRRGATHAWEYSRRPNSGPRHSYAPPPGSAAHTHYAAHGARANPFVNPNVQRATGRRGPLPTGPGPSPADSISVLGRTVTVAALVFLIATIGHGLSGSAA